MLNFHRSAVVMMELIPIPYVHEAILNLPQTLFKYCHFYVVEGGA